MKATAICSVCGDSEDNLDHHQFAPVMVPDSCVCDVNDWGDKFNVPDVCASFLPGGPAHLGEDQERCETCEHDKACHVQSPRTEGGKL